MSIFITLTIIISFPPFVIFHYCYIPFPYFPYCLPCLFVTSLILTILHILVHKGWLCHSLHSTIDIDLEILACEITLWEGI